MPKRCRPKEPLYDMNDVKEESSGSGASEKRNAYLLICTKNTAVL